MSRTNPIILMSRITPTNPIIPTSRIILTSRMDRTIRIQRSRIHHTLSWATLAIRSR